MDLDHADPAAILELAARHGLHLQPDSLRVNEMGLDFRVVLARTTHGEEWVLRIPRRREVMGRAAVEDRVLSLIAPYLSVAVPEWRVHGRNLIAYPLLPGLPGLEIDERGEALWRVDPSSESYARALGELIADVHAVDRKLALATGVTVRTPEQNRRAWREDIARVSESFTVAPHLLARWEAWLGEDSYWPEHSVLTHGELYPGHTMIEDGRITGVLDWTTALIGDPARDFAVHRTLATREAFDLTVERYGQRGGRVWPRLADHAAELAAAGPVSYGLYVLDTGDESQRGAAQAQLNPVREP